MNVKRLKVYNIKNKNYALVKFLSRIISPIIILSTLTGCFYNKKNYDNNNINYNDSGFVDYNENDKTDLNDDALDFNNNLNDDALGSNNNSNDNIVPPQESVQNSTLDLDEYSLNIIGSTVVFDSNCVRTFNNYLDNIGVYYPYSELYEIENVLSKYEKIEKYNSNSENIFKNNVISANELYDIVKKNNEIEKFQPIYILSDTEIMDICKVVSNVINDYIKANPNVDLNFLSEKVKCLKMFKINEFSNAGYDIPTIKLGVNVSLLKSKPDEYKRAIEHETYHLLQGSSISEINNSIYVSRAGISYEFKDVNINSLNWKWYYEGAAELLACNRENSKSPNVYQNQIKTFDTIKVCTLLNQNIHTNDFEEITLTSDLNNLFNYFGCQNQKERIEIANMMYAYNIIYNLNFVCDEFYDAYEVKYGVVASNSKIRNELHCAIGQTLTKQFYKNLSIAVKEKSMSVEEIFKFISIFEMSINREISYSARQETLLEFFEMYNEVQTEFLDIIANFIGVSTEDVQTAYNAYNKHTKLSIDGISIVSENKKSFYEYILETRKSNKANSINYVSEKYYGKQR